MKAVRIQWRDAHDIHPGEWVKYPKKKAVGVVAESCGFLVYEDDTHVVVAHTRTPYDKHVRGSFAIPKSCILEREDL